MYFVPKFFSKFIKVVVNIFKLRVPWYTVASLGHDIGVPMFHVDQLSDEEDVETSLPKQLSEPPPESTVSPDDTNIRIKIGKFICIENLM